MINMANIDVKKYESVVLYLAKQLGGELHGKKKLAKLLYFVDFDYFEKHETSVTGDGYKALHMGPVPEQMTAIIKALEDEKRISVSAVAEREGYLPTEIYTLTTEDIGQDLLSAEEKETVDHVVEKYGHLNGKELEILTHAEAPYLGTAPGGVIAYELAFYRGTDFSEHA